MHADRSPEPTNFHAQNHQAPPQKAILILLGHKSATMTLDLYGHLFPDRLDEVADALDVAVTAAGVYRMCTEAEIVALPTAR